MENTISTTISTSICPQILKNTAKADLVVIYDDVDDAQFAVNAPGLAVFEAVRTVAIEAAGDDECYFVGMKGGEHGRHMKREMMFTRIFHAIGEKFGYENMIIAGMELLNTDTPSYFVTLYEGVVKLDPWDGGCAIIEAFDENEFIGEPFRNAQAAKRPA